VPPTDDDAAETGSFNMTKTRALSMTAQAIYDDIKHYFWRTMGRRTIHLRQPFLFQSVVLATRDRLMERRNNVRNAAQRSGHRQTYYLSLEYLMGRLLRNALQSLGIENETGAALGHLGIELEDIYDREHDAGLGNGGLGRLAACFLDSCATLRLPVLGYGIRYHYGMFRQRIQDGYQFEEPDDWLREGFPWEVRRIELTKTIKFGGRSVAYTDEKGELRHNWTDTHDVLAIPYDILIPGFRNDHVNTLRLWSAAATDEFDLDEFNAGSYADAVAAKNAAENITMVLYPNANSEAGQELRLRQQYFLSSASLQDTLRRWVSRHGDDLSRFAELNCFQLNDTHPAMAVPELMRLLMDEHGLSWEAAWNITNRTMAYTNHTLLPEALEQWPAETFARLLPRLLDIIHEINARLLAAVAERWPGDQQRLNRMSLVSNDSTPMLRMAHLAIAGSFSVNGVAKLHSKLLCEGLFRDFAELWPEKFNNKTNGVTQRRWLAACNPGLAATIDSKISEDWITDLDRLQQLTAFADDSEFQKRWRAVKHGNKFRLAGLVEAKTGIAISADAMFDVQVKRIHEYKRQLLNLLHVIHLYDRICRGDGENLVPRVVLIGGKAAPGYVMAKHIIKCIGDVARVVNSNPATEGRLRLVFFPDYNVSAMECICPAADLSEQISTAGKEASGTGNMKFMTNGAVTIGTLDGANVEILEAVGEENFFLFGLTVEEIATLRPIYEPSSFIDKDEDFLRVMTLLRDKHFSGNDTAALDAILHSIQNPHDPWMTAADFRSFVDAQQRAEAAYRNVGQWTKMSILNTAAAGRFSSDRTILDYNRDIWRLTPIDLEA